MGWQDQGPPLNLFPALHLRWDTTYIGRFSFLYSSLNFYQISYSSVALNLSFLTNNMGYHSPSFKGLLWEPKKAKGFKRMTGSWRHSLIEEGSCYWKQASISEVAGQWRKSVRPQMSVVYSAIGNKCSFTLCSREGQCLNQEPTGVIR